MDVIELWNGSTKALVSVDGAWLTNLSDENGDILYPKRQLTIADGSKKLRGGCHVCLPNFGPGGDSGLTQHGFGRTSQWEIASQTESSVVLTLNGGAEGYEALRSTLLYTLGETSICMKLELKNSGETPLRVGPAFHPYFMLRPDEGQVKIDDQKYDLSDLSGTLYTEGEGKKLAITKRNLILSSDHLPTWAIWTDKLAPYVCVEPTLGAYTFLEKKPTEDELLQAKATGLYTLTISWE